jgi:Gpi18-like mannosyltransferase
LIFRKNGLKNLLHSVAVSAATFFIVILPFEWSNPVTFLGNAYFGAYNGYRVTSVNAFNFWGFFGFWAPDISFYMIGLALFGVSAGLTLFVLHKRFNVSGEWLVLFSAFMLLFAFFMLPTRIHERYLFPAFSMLALTFFSVKHSRILYAALTGTFLFNLSYVLISSNAADIAGRATPNLTGDPLALMVSAVNLGLFLYATVVILAELKVKGAHSNELGRDASTLSRL